VSEAQAQEWHVRRQRPNARTTLMWFIDANADRITFATFLDLLESSEAFRSLFIEELASSDVRLFVWETPGITPNGDFECALTEAPPPKKKYRASSAAYAAHLRADEPVVSFPSPEGNGTSIVPCPREADGWYAELGTFVRRVRRNQVHAMWQALAKAGKAALPKGRFWMTSSVPPAPWLEMRVETAAKPRAYAPYSR
jgi:hypothetical protein